MKNLKILFILAISVVIVSWAFAFDTNFSFSPASGTKFKLYCEYPVHMIIDWWSEKFNWFDAGILFDNNNITLKNWVIHSEFPNWNNFLDWNIYNVWWAMAWWFKEWILTWVSFKILSKSNITFTSLSFVDKNWNIPNFWLDTTDDGITLNGYDQWQKDILSSVSNVTYQFVALPCDADSKAPTIANVSIGNWSTKIPEYENISFLTYDWDTNKKVKYWFSWNVVWDISNYVAAPDNVDNQEWVDRNKIFVKVSCPSCSPSRSDILVHPLISDWNWENDKNALTWDSERRWYVVSFDAPFPYEVEKQVTVNISVSDNPNENWDIHTWTYSFSFNAPVAPSITRISPATNTFVSPSKEFPISFYISDDRAGVDTWSIVVSIPQIVSGGVVIFPWYVYSWTELDFELSWWSNWLWNAWGYIVSFYPNENFPVSTEITINVSWADLAWTSRSITSTFSTRPSCSYFWCVDSLSVFWNGLNMIFSWVTLLVTWTNPNSPYPYLLWENSDILMCGVWWTWVSFGGNVPIYDNEWNWIWESLYTNNKLFITWLDFVYESWMLIIK